MMMQPKPDVRRHALRIGVFSVLLLMALVVWPVLSPVAADEPKTCVDDVTGRTNNCTAEDVKVSELRNQVDLVCPGGTTVELDLRAKLVANSDERYDIGMFVALDGGKARTGSCFHDFLHPVVAGGTCSISGAACLKDKDCKKAQGQSQTCNLAYQPGSGVGPYYDAEEGEDPTDLCGDIEKGVATYYDMSDVSVPCLDANGDGKLDVGTCLSWDNASNEKQSHCVDVTGAVPGTKSKCRCEMITVGNVTVLPGPIEVEKTGVECVKEDGDPALYTIQITNTNTVTSEVSLLLDSLMDDPFGDLTDAENDLVWDSTCELVEIQPGEAYTCTFQAGVKIGEGGEGSTDTVIVMARDREQNEVMDADSATVGLCEQPPDTGVMLPAPLLIGGLAGIGLALIAVGILVQGRMRTDD